MVESWRTFESGLMNTRPWNGLVLGILIVSMMPFAAATSAGRVDPPWPALLAGDPLSGDLRVAMLQYRASVSLERLLQSAPVEQ